VIFALLLTSEKPVLGLVIWGRMHDVVVSTSLTRKSTYDGLAH